MLRTQNKVIANLCKMASTQIRKSGFVDTGMAAAGAGAAPMDPAAGGGAPMDPAMAGGAPMDPAMAGGAPPPPPGDPMAGPGGSDEIRQIIQQELAAAGIGGKAIKPKPVDERMARVEHMLASIVDFLKMPVSATQMVDPLGMGPQEQGEGGGGGAPGGGGDPGAAAAAAIGAGGGGDMGGGEPKMATALGKLSYGFENTHGKASAISELLRRRREGAA